jgi:hypothetical protein
MKPDPVIIICVVLVCVIAFLHFKDKKERFSTEIDPNDPSYFTTNPKSLNNPNYARDVAPPFLKCYNCNMRYDCSNYAYDSNDKHMSVCRKCHSELVPEIPSHNTIHNKVLGKSPGRPNQNRRLF